MPRCVNPFKKRLKARLGRMQDAKANFLRRKDDPSAMRFYRSVKRSWFPLVNVMMLHENPPAPLVRRFGQVLESGLKPATPQKAPDLSDHSVACLWELGRYSVRLQAYFTGGMEGFRRRLEKELRLHA